MLTNLQHQVLCVEKIEQPEASTLPHDFSIKQLEMQFVECAPKQFNMNKVL